MVNRVLLFFFLCGLFLTGHTQSSSNLRFGRIVLHTQTTVLDSLSLVPGSFHLEELDSSAYSINYISSTLFLYDSVYLGKELNYSYRVFEFNFSKQLSHKSISLISPKSEHYAPYVIAPSKEGISAFLYDPTLQSSGSIARGLSIGNNQDFALNSSLNLQLSGQLSEDLNIIANITDKNIPIQPEGNTRIIQDFNKIFIQLNYKNQFSLNAGDIEIHSPDNYFLKVNKNVLGMTFTSSVQLDSINHLTNVIGGGINKGKFARNTLTPMQGIQGPYQLRGNQNEIQIMIIAGSERVYIDGQLMTRGRENDYSIDYNTGEITFSSRQLITTEKRIIVEFEYSDNAYSRYSLFSYNSFNHERINKLKLNVNFYHEQDLKNRSIQPELTLDQMKYLSTIGNNISEAFYLGADSVPYNNNEVLYKKMDTIVAGINYTSIYVRTTNKNDICYRIRFSYMGNNKGNYILSVAEANGRVFQWVAPIEGVPQGNYEPVILLATPRLVQMGTIGAEMKLSDHSKIQAEIALSNYDQNTFSDKDDEHNVGFAGKINYLFKKELLTKKNHKWVWKNILDYEFIHKNFQSIETFRPIEFSRIYNLEEDYSENKSEQMLQFSSELSQVDIGKIKYQINYFSRNPELNLLRNEFESSTKYKGFLFYTKSSYLYSEDEIQRTHFVNTDNTFAKEFKHIEIGIKENLEYNIFRLQENSTLRPNSYAFNDLKFYLKNSNNSDYIYQISYKNRIEHTTNEATTLSLHSIINEAQSSFEITKIKNQRFRGNATYRNTALKDTNSKFNRENHFIGSLEYSGKFFKNALTLTTFYEAGSGLEQKRTYSFLKVLDGQGTHIWIDYNENGIEELNEFEIAVFRDEANYVKIILTGNDYINTYNNQFAQTIGLYPGAVWRNKTHFRKFLSQFSNLTTLRVSQKNTIQNSFNAFNPFNFNIKDSLLINQNLNFKNTFSFNQYDSYFGIDFIIQRNQMKNLLYYGFERNQLNTEEIIITGNPHRTLNISSQYTHALKSNQSEFFESRNYRIKSHQINNSILIQLRSKLFFTLIYQYQQKNNTTSIDKVKKHQIEFNTTYRMPERGNIMAQIRYIYIVYNESENNSLAYEMLEGLQNGKNIHWKLAYQSYIGKFLEIDFQYEGRASEGKRTIHSGSIQMRAHF